VDRAFQRHARKPVAVAVVRQTPISVQTASLVFLLGWWIAQMALAYLHPDALADSTDKEAVLSNASTAVASGGLQNTLLVGSFGMFGAWHLVRAWPAVRKQAILPLLVLLGLYLIWAAASLVWTVDLVLTARRLVQLLLLIVGSIGVGVGVYGRSESALRSLPKHLLLAGGIATATLCLSLATSGATNVLDPAYSTKNLGLWTTVAHPIACAAFAAVYLAFERRLLNWQLALILVAWALALFVQKVRFIALYSALLLAVLLLHGVSPRRLWMSLLPVLLVATLALAAFAALGTQSVDPVLKGVLEYASLDQGADNLAGLSGRSDLWAELMNAVGARPVQGYGFGAFWTPDRLQEIALALTWAPTVAHNGFLDELLATGLIGLTLNLAFWLVALGVAVYRGIVDRDEFAWFAAACIAFFLLLNWGDSILQFYFRFPFYVSLIALFALLAQPRSHRTLAPVLTSTRRHRTKTASMNTT
jgi:exopolysaccharide production protein ExoQ